jgi:hypothetical protein
MNANETHPARAVLFAPVLALGLVLGGWVLGAQIKPLGSATAM